jgi:hypothetical protein
MIKESQGDSDAGRNNKKQEILTNLIYEILEIISFYKFPYPVKLHSAQTLAEILTNFQS